MVKRMAYKVTGIHRSSDASPIQSRAAKHGLGLFAVRVQQRATFERFLTGFSAICAESSGDLGSPSRYADESTQSESEIQVNGFVQVCSGQSDDVGGYVASSTHEPRGQLTSVRRILVRIVATVAIVMSGLVVAAAPASAAITWLPKLCTGFADCNKKKMGNDGYEAVYKTKSYWGMDTGHNCTNYVAYRLDRNGVKRFTVVREGDAWKWGAAAKKAGLVVDKSTPRAGDVAWWDRAARGNTYGHIAYVEKVNNDGTFIVSEDNYLSNGTGDFDWRTYKTSEVSGFIRTAKGSAKALSAVPTPTITGSAAVGSVLTAKAGTWSPAPITLIYQWKRNGANISAATATTYRVTDADVGAKLTVTVTGLKSGYTTVTKTSAATATVPGKTIQGVIPTPTISGTAKQGSVLTAAVGTWPAGVSVAYQWKRNGANISGATGATFKLGERDIGAKLTVSTTGSKSGYVSVSRTSAATAVVVSIPGDRLAAGKQLGKGQALYSTNGKYRLSMQADGNLVLYNISGTARAVWATGTNTKAGHRVTMQTDGNLVVYTSAKKPVWASNTNSKKVGGQLASRLVVQSDGNVVLYTSTGRPIWATNTVGE